MAAQRQTQLLTTAEAAERLRVSKRTVERLVAAKRIARTDVGTGAGETRIPDWAVEEYIERQTTPAAKSRGRAA